MSDLNPYKECMTLRDWFAGQALATQYTQCETDPSKTAEWAYQVADAMLNARRELALDVLEKRVEQIKAERDAAVKALEYYAVKAMLRNADDTLVARTALAKIKEGKL